jgi:hypothetical protein
VGSLREEGGKRPPDEYWMSQPGALSIRVIRLWIASHSIESNKQVRLVVLDLALNKHQRFSVIERSRREASLFWVIWWHF